ncbi:MAG: tripartite tricarboxylate transporter substrate binding protein [Rhizobacter sp.]|nr:tripartite tricarboxylate transporter substrate binding protein [Rhizobacter sp.]
MDTHLLGRRKALRRLVQAGFLTGMATTGVRAQGAWPTQPVRIVVPYGPGGSTDALARLLATRFGDALGKTFIVENRPGANGNLGAASVASAPADGHTLMLSTTGPLSLNKLLYKATPFDPLTDFAPIALLAEVPLLLAAHSSVPARTPQQLVGYLKSKPGKISYSTAGNGSLGHLAAELFQRATGTQMVHIPYRGSSGALSDLMAGVVELSFDLLPTYLPQIEAGRIKAVALLGAQRTPQLPDTPTLLEVGIKADATGWYGFVGPKGLPSGVVAQLNRIVNEFLRSTEGRAQMQTFSMRPIGGPPQALSKLAAAEIAKWRPIIEPLAATIMQ